MSGGAASAGYYSAMMNPLLQLRNASPVSGTGSIGQMGGGAGGGVSPLAMLLAAHLMQGGGPMAGQAPQPAPEQQNPYGGTGGAMSGLQGSLTALANARKNQGPAPTYQSGAPTGWGTSIDNYLGTNMFGQPYAGTSGGYNYGYDLLNPDNSAVLPPTFVPPPTDFSAPQS